MQSSGVRAAIGFGTIALIVVLFIVLSGGDDDGSSPTTTAATTPAPSTTTTPTATTGQPEETKRAARPRPETVTVRGGKPVGGVERLEYERGDRVRFRVRSDVTDEVHVHGYDVFRDVAAGGSVTFSFPARLEGVFEVELENRHEQIAELRVTP